MKELLPWLAVAAAAAAAGYVAATGVGGTTGATPRPTIQTAKVGAKRPPTRPRPKRTPRVLVVDAVRGDCWIEAHAGTRSGRVVYRALLRHGRSARFTSRLIWITFGDSTNVDVRLAGRLLHLPKGTVTQAFELRPVGPNA